MLSWIRDKFGKIVIGAIIGLIGFVFIFSGVLNPKATRGIHEGAVAGKVNGESITIAEFNRDLNRRLEFFKNLMGGSVSEDQLKAFKVREMVFQDLARRKLLVQEAYKQGMVVSDDQVKESIREIPAFQKDGKFDVLTYKQVLQANNFTPGGFEKLIREDASAQQWQDYFRRRVHVSMEEARREFLISQEKRKLKYVVLTVDAGRKSVEIKAEDVQKYLADPNKLNVVRAQFETKKETAFKGKTFDAMKEAIARDILAGEKLPEIQKNNEALADQVVAAMAKDKASDAKVNAILKGTGVEVKTSDWMSRQNAFLPGAGDVTSVLADAFAAQSPIDGKAKKYTTASSVVVALMAESQNADLAKFETEREKLTQQIAAKKQRELYQQWMEGLVKKADIDMNPDVVGSDG